VRAIKTIEELDMAFNAIDMRRRRRLKRARGVMDECWREVAALRKRVDEIVVVISKMETVHSKAE